MSDHVWDVGDPVLVRSRSGYKVETYICKITAAGRLRVAHHAFSGYLYESDGSGVGKNNDSSLKLITPEFRKIMNRQAFVQETFKRMREEKILNHRQACMITAILDGKPIHETESGALLMSVNIEEYTNDTNN